MFLSADINRKSLSVQAFVELGSVDQANELVKFHRNNPPIVNGEQMEFNISNTFNFLQVPVQHIEDISVVLQTSPPGLSSCPMSCSSDLISNIMSTSVFT